MKKSITITLATLLMLASCGTTGEGAFTGATFGGIIGSAIGGITGGPRGSDIGTLIGMATGAAAGAAVGSAAEKSKGYPDDAVYSDPSNRNAPQARVDYDPESATAANDISIKNAEFRNTEGTRHISRGETASITFEIHNVTNDVLTNIVPIVQETTGNKRLSVSPAILLETLGPKKAIRYTAFITAQDNLKTGTAQFSIKVTNSTEIISNTVKISDIALN